MASLVKVNEALGKVVTFLAPLVPLIQCHMVDFLTMRHWDTLLPPQLQQDLLSLPSDILHLLPSASLPHNTDKPSEGSDEPWDLSSTDLSSLLWQVHRHCLAHLGVMTPIEQILAEYGSAEISTLAMKGIMSNKKTHEVDAMAQVIARLAQGLSVNWLVDLGSGRGYLSTSLALQYSLNVVAVDSSTTNTTSALVRNTKLKRWWDSLRQTWLDRTEGRPVKKGKHRRKQRPLSSPQQQQEGRMENVGLVLKKQESITLDTRKQERMEQGKKLDRNKQEDQRQDAITHQESEGSESLASHVGHYIGVTKFITEDTDLLEVVRSSIRTEKVTRESRDSDRSETVNSESDQYTYSANTPHNTTIKPPDIEITADQYTSIDTTHTTNEFNTTETRKPPDIETSTNQYTASTDRTYPTRKQAQDMKTSRDHYISFPTTSTGTNEASEPICMVGDISTLGLVGLHTCGNLASSSLRLFTANTRVAFLCNVGCCYHLLEEEFSRNTYNQQKLPLNKLKSLSISKKEECLSVNEQNNDVKMGHPERGDAGDTDPLHPSTIPNLGHGFPLSTFLRDKKFSLGRNSRMLASQATDRLTQGNTGSAEPLYWRALLQVVLVDKLGDVSHLSHVGRLSAKCRTFPEYARAALARLEVPLEITEEELQEYDRRHCSHKSRLERFFLLRASLAAVVEGVVLLDRLAYLCQQDDMAAFLVQLFDPVTSPRSHALIAVRMRQGATASVTNSPVPQTHTLPPTQT